MSRLPRLVCASANPDKVAEITEILSEVVDLVPRPGEVPDVVEDADTLEGNARLKAIAICDATGLPAVADDTGLEVVALDGAPGVHSARWAGEGCSYADNRRKLLGELGDEHGHRIRIGASRRPHAQPAARGACSRGTLAPGVHSSYRRRRTALRSRCGTSSRGGMRCQ